MFIIIIIIIITIVIIIKEILYLSSCMVGEVWMSQSGLDRLMI